MSNFVQNETFDATQFALDEVVAYYGEDTADSDIYEGLLDDTWRNYDYDYDYYDEPKVSKKKNVALITTYVVLGVVVVAGIL